MDLSPVVRSHKWLNLPDHEGGAYNLWDCYATRESEAAVRKELKRTGNDTYFATWWPFVRVVGEMQRGGFGHLDRTALTRYKKKLRRELREIEGEMLEGVEVFDHAEILAYKWAEMHWLDKAGKAEKQRAKGLASRLSKVEKRREKFFNMSSDLKHHVFDVMGLKPAPTTHKRPARSLDQEALEWVLDHLRARDRQHIPFLHNLFHRSRLRTILQRYLNIWTGPDDRIYPTISCGTARTMRLAVSKPPMQQWPKEVRHVVMPRPGCVFVGVDYSQLEARIMAKESEDTPLLEAFACGADPHAQNARELFMCSEAEWDAMPTTTRELYRNFAKSFFYGLGYGGRAETLHTRPVCPCWRCEEERQDTLELTSAQKARAESNWMSRHPDYVRWRQRHLEGFFRRGRTYTSRFGYTRRVREDGSRAERVILNYPMQHGAAKVVERAMVDLHAAGVPLVFQVHDELIAEPLARDADDVLRVMKEVMEQPIPEYDGMRFPTKGHIGHTWGELK